jgi:hypothetical protein
MRVMLTVGTLPQQGHSVPGSVRPKMFSPFALGHLQHQLRPVGLQAGGDQRRGSQVEAEHDAAREPVGLLLDPCVVGGHHAIERVARRAFGQARAEQAEQAAQLCAPHRIARPAEGGHRRLQHLGGGFERVVRAA